MGNDLISRSALRDQLGKYFFLYDGNDFMEVMRKVEKAPAVDAVEVVRCAECVTHSYDEERGRHWCNNPMGNFGCALVKPDDFCSRGKRREDAP